MELFQNIDIFFLAVTLLKQLLLRLQAIGVDGVKETICASQSGTYSAL